MACVSPPELTDLQLLTFIDGDADAAVQRHVAVCAGCRSRAEALARWQTELSARLFRADCPPSLELGEYQMGLLPRPRAQLVERHVAVCPHCQHELAQFAEFMAEPPPAPVEMWAPVRDRLRVLVAQLVSGGRSLGAWGGPSLAPALAGVRGDDNGPLIFQAGDVELAMDVQPDQQPGLVTLFGLVSGIDDPADAEVRLWRQNRLVAATQVDDLGNFVVAALPPDRYELILTATDVEIHVQALDLGPTSAFE